MKSTSVVPHILLGISTLILAPTRQALQPALGGDADVFVVKIRQ